MTLETLVLILVVWPCVIGLCLAVWFDKRAPLLPDSTAARESVPFNPYTPPSYGAWTRAERARYCKD